jgi:predicted O-methyltransferase YrrM
MSLHTIIMSEPLLEYLQQVSLREPPVLKRLREETAKRADSNMQICPEQGQFMSLLIELCGARRAIEIGTYTGYSALCVAAVLPADGKLICCDVNEETTAIAQRYWAEAGLGERIELRLAPAKETLDQLIASAAASFDFGFIDADKANYDAYYECLLRLIRPGGLIVIDNVLWNGAVIDPDKNDADTKAIRLLNNKLLVDERVSLSMLPIGDGLTLARVR